MRVAFKESRSGASILGGWGGGGGGIRPPPILRLGFVNEI